MTSARDHYRTYQEASEEGASLERFDTCLRALQEKTRRSLTKKLTPLLEKSFEWHCKKDLGYMEADEFVIFFGNYMEQLAGFIASTIDIPTVDQLDPVIFAQGMRAVDSVGHNFLEKKAREHLESFTKNCERHR